MEIYTGIDIVENERIKNAVERLGDKFLHRVFTEREIDYCKQKVSFYPCLAARFAAKEAFIKAYYQAFKEKLFFKQIEVLGKKNSPAEILLHIGNSEAKQYKIPFKSSISISHENKFSVAVVVIYLPKVQ